MGIFNKLFGGSNDQTPPYSGEALEQFLDGFRVGLPLVGQPDYPDHGTKPYKYGKKLGRQAYEEAGRPQIPYEPAQAEDE